MKEMEEQDTRWSKRLSGLGYGYKEWGNMGCFEYPIV